MDVLCGQLEVCRAHGVACVPTAPEAKLGVALGTLDGRLPLNGLRHPPTADTCGWYIWAGEDWPDADDAFAPLHAEHLHQRVPEALPYLGLPPGWRFLVAGDYADVWYDAALLDV
jgi:hypothetical protein